MRKILIVDDHPHIARTLEIMLSDDGYDVLKATSGEMALSLLEAHPIDFVLLDLHLPGISGLEVLRRLRDCHRDVDVIVITAHGSVQTAVEAMKEGAFDYMTKPFSPEEVRHRLSQLEQIRALKDEVAGLRRRMGELPFGSELITQSPAVLHLLEIAKGVALSDATILLTGETGTGKTQLARLIHSSSRRQHGPFVTLDCTSFQETLLESELFGHQRGAFTGAVADKIGKVETAEGGTLFLDEVGDIPLHLQSKLLRLMEQKSYERLGDPTPRHVDARIIAATHRDLTDMVREKMFREDLFYRLSVVELVLPALRSRPEDILLLARNFVAKFSQAHGKQVTEWQPDVESTLIRYSWPGNVRELAHAIERAVLLAPGREIRLEHLPERMTASFVGSPASNEILSLAALEERHIRYVLSLQHSLEETAHLLGINTSTLWRKRKKYNI